MVHFLQECRAARNFIGKLVVPSGIGRIADSSQDHRALFRLHGTDRDVDGKFGSILAHSDAIAQTRISISNPLGYESLDGFADQLGPLIAKCFFAFGIRLLDRSLIVDDKKGIGSVFEELEKDVLMLLLCKRLVRNRHYVFLKISRSTDPWQ